MATTIKNASPQVISLGTNDLSTRVVLPTPLEIPQHLPKSYIFAKKGPTVPTPVSGGAMLALYGADTFDHNKGYYNHATRFSNAAVGTGNTVMFQRVIPTDAGANSNVTVYIDVLNEVEIDNFKRNSTGDIVLDVNSDPELDGTTPVIAGMKVNIVAEYTTDDMYVFGTAVSKPGNLSGVLESDGTTPVTSTMYPIMEFKAAFQGLDYNNIGIAIEKMLSADIDSRLLDANKALPYTLSLFNRDEAGSKPVRMASLFGEPSVMFSFKDKAVNPLTDSRYDLETVFDGNWYNKTNSLLPLKYNDFANFKVYRDNLELVYGLAMTNENTYVNTTDVRMILL